MDEKMKKEMLSWVKSIVIAVVIVFVCRQFIFEPIAVRGESMLPTLEHNNRVVISKTSDIERFDMIVFDAPDANAKYVKRVVGVPGDHIEMKDDVLYINSQAYDEDYVKQSTTLSRTTQDFTLEELTQVSIIPEGHYFVLGDNRRKSNDSREFGLISADTVLGEVKLRIYPFDEIEITE
ncbi:signal peptidase I [Jeotgalibacillus sp. R-1-5s-1]|uniref:signal peptidase I n=1 Tax=Jeotgalibacillus sp. R-1-5s-1 TaxID=2555897 RepID=UPI00106DAF8B|nr:signal peptidase I [Jeotgalibacillus sp. R-1-5s-1]TFD94393.1 signal peptidase I [Jeotgalibacillus sp. R-1-5s-1]